MRSIFGFPVARIFENLGSRLLVISGQNCWMKGQKRSKVIKIIQKMRQNKAWNGSFSEYLVFRSKKGLKVNFYIIRSLFIRYNFILFVEESLMSFFDTLKELVKGVKRRIRFESYRAKLSSQSSAKWHSLKKRHVFD